MYIWPRLLCARSSCFLWMCLERLEVYSLLTGSSFCFSSSPFQDCFAEVFGRDGAAGARRTREALSRWLLAGVVLLTGVLVGVFIAKKQWKCSISFFLRRMLSCQYIRRKKKKVVYVYKKKTKKRPVCACTDWMWRDWLKQFVGTWSYVARWAVILLTLLCCLLFF